MRPGDLPHGRFVTTRWSLVLAVRGDGEPARAALADLSEAYWYPVYVYLRRAGRSADDAAELTQEFFTKIIEKRYFAQAEQTRGRFRSFLLTALKHFLANQRDAAVALKRGGGLTPIRLEFDDGEVRFSREPVDSRSPDDVFEAQWAQKVIASARHRLFEKHRAGWMKGSRFFDALVSHVIDDTGERFAALAARLETTEGSLRVMAHRIREQYGGCLREVIEDTVDSSDAVDDELRHLLYVLGRK